MIVVSDTTPLISLIKIGRLKLMEQLFGEIQIPNAVYQELIVNPQFNEEALQLQNCDFIKYRILDDTKSVELLSDICGADLLLMDERKGRQVAKQMGLHLMGTVGILRAAYEDSLLTYEEILDCIENLKLNGRHISDTLFQQLLDAIQP